MLEPFIPSLIIVVSVTAAFVTGRVVALIVRRLPRLTTAANVAAAVLTVGFLVLFATNGSSRYALLLPAAFAVGFFKSRRKLAPGVFE